MAVLLTYGTGATYSLNPGQETTLTNAATGTGVALSAQFTLVPAPGGGDKTMLFQALGTFTVCTANLEISSDGELVDSLGGCGNRLVSRITGQARDRPVPFHT